VENPLASIVIFHAPVLILQFLHLLIGSDGKLYVEECGTSGDQLNSMREAKNFRKLRELTSMLLVARLAISRIWNKRARISIATKPLSSHSYVKCG
jgi:hypothetical protein